MIRIVLLDDHTLFRMGIIGILSDDHNIEIVGEYQAFAQLKPLLPAMQADIIFVDISLQDESGLDIARYIKNVNPSLKVIILSSHKEEFYIINALEAQVDGYISKDVDPDELLVGIHRVMKGEKFFSLEISSLLINNVYNKAKGGLPFLTNKEKQIVSFLMEGCSSKEIADRLDISQRTVETHRANVLKKFNLKNTTELIKKIIEQKMRF